MGLFGKEKMILKLEKDSYKPGETIKGLITLNLKKPIKARKLEIDFIGAIKKFQQGHRYHGQSSADYHMYGSHESMEPFYTFNKTIGNEREYANEDISFEITIPPDVHESEPKSLEKMEGLMKFAQKLGGKPPEKEWYVRVHLDVPMKLDLEKSQKIELL